MGQACRVAWAEDVAWLLCSLGSLISLIRSFNIPWEPNPYSSSCRYEKHEILDIFKRKTASVFRFALSIVVVVLAAQSCLTLCNPIDRSPLGSSVHKILQARILESIFIPFSRHLPDPGTKLRSLALQSDSLPSEPPGKPTELVCRARITTLQFHSKSKEGNSFSRINDATLDQATGNFLIEDLDFISTSFRAK